MNDKSQSTVTNGVYESKYMRVPIIKTRWQAFTDCIYNPVDKTILTRTPRQWGITGLFYLFFFSGLIVLFAICMKVLVATLDIERPRYILDESLIGINPGLAFYPNDTDESIISYTSSNESEIRNWINRLDANLEGYRNSQKLPNGGRNQQVCNYAQHVKSGMVCDFDMSDWGLCTSTQGYGFNKSAPCIFLKLNRIIGWIPQVYNDTKDLPSEMPKSLVEKIAFFKDKPESNTIWVSCKGKHVEDEQNIGEIKYYPQTQGFPSYYYPYKNTPGYLSPLVAVNFGQLRRNQTISIECRAWAKNIEQDSHHQTGVTLFQLLIND